ncbi:MAG: Rnf-Nqr domain containing protein, partial [Oscillospiraceae bacterium]
PVLEKGLILAPVVVASYNWDNAFVLGCAFMIITFFSVLISSFVPKKIPYTVRTIIYTLIASLIFIPVAYYMNMIYPETVFKLGVFLPLLIANSLIVVKSESRFHQHTKGYMLVDLFCHCVGFFFVIMFVGILRELLGSGSFMGIPINGMIKAPSILLPFSGFVIVGFLAAILRHINFLLNEPKYERSDRAKQKENAEKK